MEIVSLGIVFTARGIEQGSGVPAPNLTLVVPNISQEQFQNFFHSGILPSGKKVNDAIGTVERRLHFARGCGVAAR